MKEVSGLSYQALISAPIELAIERNHRNANRKVVYEK
jgi:hypothetical protein